LLVSDFHTEKSSRSRTVGDVFEVSRRWRRVSVYSEVAKRTHLGVRRERRCTDVAGMAVAAPHHELRLVIEMIVALVKIVETET
jgi:hypothetical protein